MIAEFEPLQEVELLPPVKRSAYGEAPVVAKTDLFHALPDLAQPQESVTPQAMERMGQSYGYMLYSAVLESSSELNSLKLFKAADRAIAFIDKQRAMTAYDRELEVRHEVGPFHGKNMHLDILVENMGRVNYGPYLNWQRKGIDGCVMINDRFAQHNWKQYALPMTNLDQLNFCLLYTSGR